MGAVTVALVGYEHDPATGLYRFQDDSGAVRSAFGAEAQSLAQFIDRTQPRLAQNMSVDPGPVTPAVNEGLRGTVFDDSPPSPAPSAADVPAGGMMTAPEPDAPMMTSTGEVVRGEVGRPAPMPSPQQAGQQVVAGEEPSPPLPFDDPVERARFMLPTRRVGGRAAFDPAAYDASQAPVRTGVTTTVEGAMPETPQETERRIKAEEQRRGMFDATMQATEENQRAQAALLSKQAADAKLSQVRTEGEIREHQNKLLREETDARAVRARLEGDIERVRTRTVDQNRLFRDKGVGGQIVNAIAVALGAFGSGLTGGPNTALQILNANIERDIAAQEDDIARDGVAADNALSRFERHYGLSREEAREAVRLAQLAHAQAVASEQQATIGTLKARQDGETLKLGLAQEFAKTEALLNQATKGRMSQVEQARMMAPQRASAGHVEVDWNQAAKNAQFLQNYDKALGKDEDGQHIRAKHELSEDLLKRRVTMPDGSFAWATSKERADKAQVQMDSAFELKANIAKQRAILEMIGDSVDPERRGQYNTLAARNKILFKGLEDLGAITEADADMVNPLTGEGGQALTKFKAGVLAAARSSEQHVDFRLREANKQLFREPDAKTLVTKTEEGLGIKEEP